MAQLTRRAVSTWALPIMAVAAALACSPGYVAADSQSDGTGGGSDEGTGGSDGTDSSDGTDGPVGSGGSDGSTDGSGGSDDGSGGSDGSTGGTDAGSGGSDTGSGGFDSSCSPGDTCIAAANFNDECFSPDCSAPVAAKQSEVDRDVCLVPWDDRASEIPADCAAHYPPPSPCPAVCEIQPPCVDATCHGNGECGIEICVQ